MSSRRIDLSIVIPAAGEADNLALLLPELRAALEAERIRAEILVVERQADPPTAAAVALAGGELIIQTERGYGGALLVGFARASARYLLTMDADLSHPAKFVRTLWAARDLADVVIASRYVPGGLADMPIGRFILSKVLNRVFSRGLSLQTRDMSSGFRLYHAAVVKDVAYRSRDFNVLQEILVRAFADGWRVAEVPFEYAPRVHGASHARVLEFGIAYLRTFRSLWKLRNSLDCADYDARAFDGPIPLQRYWQRQRVRHVTELSRGAGPALDVGCGSSRILEALPEGSVGLDVLTSKLRYARWYGKPVVRASGAALPFADGAFPCVVCSQVIEHVPKEAGMLEELCRVVAPGGRLVLGTPDYGRWEWRAVERLYRVIAPGGWADQHVAHYTYDELVRLLLERGYALEEQRYVLNAELVLSFRKPRANLQVRGGYSAARVTRL